MTNKTKKEEPKESFELSLERLEDIVRKLESGDQGLEASLKLFEDGASLSKQLTQRLEEAKHKVEVLTKSGKEFKVQALAEE